MTALGIPFLILLLTVPGLCLYGLLNDKLRQDFSLATRWAFILGISVVLTTLIMVVFLLLDAFPVEWLAALYALWLGIWMMRRLIPWKELVQLSVPNDKEGKRNIIVGIGVVVLLVLLFCQPTEYYFGGRDPGIYTSTAVQISRLGKLKVEDPLIQGLIEEYPGVFIDGSLKFMGVFTERQGDTYYTNPQFYHGYSAWLAAGHRFFGFDGFLYMTPILGLISMLVLYAAVSNLWDKRTGFLTVLLLGLNIAQIWYARGPYSEILSQLVIWFCILFTVQAWRTKSSLLAAVAGLAAGATLLVRLDNIFIAIPVGLSLIFILADNQGKLGRWGWSFVLSLGVFCGVFVSYALKFGREYTRDLLIEQSPVPDSFTLEMLFLTLGAMAAGGFLIAILLRRQWVKLLEWARSKREIITVILGIGTVLIFGWLYFIRPLNPTPDLLPEGTRTFREESLVRLGWYISPLGILLALGGFVEFIHNRFRKQHVFPILFILTFCGLYLYDPRIYPDHFWAVRRYVPIIIPSFTVFMAYMLNRLSRTVVRKTSLKPVSLAATAFLCIFLLYEALPFLYHTEYKGAGEGMEKLAGFFDEDDIVIAWDAHFASRLAGTPLYFMYGKNVLTLEGTFNGENLAKFIEDKKAEGRDVYFLLSSEDNNMVGNPFYLAYRNSVDFKLRNTEVRADRKPRNISSWIWRVNIYEPVAGPIPWDDGKIDIGNPEDINYRIEGLYGSEGNGQRDYRWSGPESIVEIPLPAGFDATGINKLTIRGRHLLPSDVLSEDVEVTLNGQFIGTIEMTGEFQEYSLEFPKDALQYADNIIIHFRTKTWKPQELGMGADTRDLGFMLDYVQIGNSED